MTSHKVVIERKKCTSCGNCVDICSDFFKISDDGYSHLKESERVEDNDELNIEDFDCCLDAALECPVACIHIFKNGEEIT